MKKVFLMMTVIVLFMGGVSLAQMGYGSRDDFVVKMTWANGQNECQKWGKKMAGVFDFRGKWPNELKEGYYWTSTRYKRDRRMATIINVKKKGNQIKTEIGAYRRTTGKRVAKFNVWCVSPNKKGVRSSG